MITVDGPISFFVGGAVALACRSATGDKVRDRDRTLFNGFLLQTVVLTPVILFFMLRFPDWEWNYFFNAKEFFFGGDSSFGIWIIAIIIALMNLSYVAGFFITEKMIKKDQVVQPILMLGSVLILMGYIMLSMIDQSLHIGTLEEYQSGEASLIFFSPSFLFAQTVAVVLIALGFKQIVRTAKRAEA